MSKRLLKNRMEPPLKIADAKPVKTIVNYLVELFINITLPAMSTIQTITKSTEPVPIEYLVCLNPTK